MRPTLLLICSLAWSASCGAQEIVKVPANSAPTVARPDDLFALPPDQWHFARQLWEGRDACTQDQCEAGYTSGDLVVSVEHAGKFVRIIAGLRQCSGVAYSEIESGAKPGKSTRKKVAKQVQTVVKGLGKSCSSTPPSVPPLDAALLFASTPSS